MSRRFLICSLLFLGLLVSPLKAQDFKQENKPENLKQMMQLAHKTIHQDKNLDGAKKLLGGIFVNEARAKVALKGDVSAEHVKAILGWHTQMGGTDAALTNGARNFCKAEQSEVQVHASTTEELIAYKQGSPAFNEFPGGARDMASKVLKPGVTFYEVEFVKPGEQAGMKYHLFYWDGKQWAMMGAIWRVVK